MAPPSHPAARIPPTFRLFAVLLVASTFLAWIVTFVGAAQSGARRAEARHLAAEGLALSLAHRVAPLLERDDELRLAAMAAAAADLGRSRILVLDRNGQVVLDSGLTLGGVPMLVLSAPGPLRRVLDDGSHEAVAPARIDGRLAGEVRIRYEADPRAPSDFSWSLFGIVFLASLSLAVIACLWSQQVMVRVDEAAHTARMLAKGEWRAECRRTAAGPLKDLQQALRALGDAIHDGMVGVEQSVLALARQLVDHMEHRGQLVPGRGERTAKYARILADRLGLLPADRRELELACQLHEIGIAAVRPTALSASGRLDGDERASWMQFPVHGAAFFAGIPGMERVAAVIRHHREKYDGTGFPDGLRGERIPLGARILAIASAYDQLTSATLQREALPWPDALDTMHEDRGEHFDPWLLDLFEEEIRKSPVPAKPVQPVMISREGLVPYRAAEPAARREEELVLEDEELELLSDDPRDPKR